jgi:NAD(P)-dependent dehydrogenase (short-subunit alcohol dehydrogenase family)
VYIAAVTLAYVCTCVAYVCVVVWSTGARVILACRDVDKAEAVRRDIVTADNCNNAVVMRLDLSSMKSIRHFADQFNRSKCLSATRMHGSCVACNVNFYRTEIKINRHKGYVFQSILKKKLHAAVITTTLCFFFATIDPDGAIGLYSKAL